MATKSMLSSLVILGLALQTFAQAEDRVVRCGGPARTGQKTISLQAAFPDCTAIVSSATCDSTVCARYGVTCHWDATKDTKCTCVTSSVTEVFFSEYVEGGANNRALEIFNGTGALIDLFAEGYTVQFFFNGSTTAGATIPLTGTVADGDVFVLASSNASSALTSLADQTQGGTWFNGDDVVLLRKSGVVVDSIGQLGSDPGAGWGSGAQATADKTLQRDNDVCRGDVDPDGSFDPATEWTGSTRDDFSGLGSHSTLCGTVLP